MQNQVSITSLGYIYRHRNAVFLISWECKFAYHMMLTQQHCFHQFHRDCKDPLHLHCTH